MISHEVRYDNGALAIPQKNYALPHRISGRINVIDESDEFLYTVVDRRTHWESGGGIISYRLPKEWTAVSAGYTWQSVCDSSWLGPGLVPHIDAGSADGHDHVLSHFSSLFCPNSCGLPALCAHDAGR
jgi:hypothetical protein